MKEPLSRITIVCGHYGTGKTNLTVNLALRAAAAGEDVTVMDMDVVNPYFRTADFRELFDSRGIRLIAPTYAGSNLDIPVLPPTVAAAIRTGKGRLFLDVGGDDDGAVALGGFSAILKEQGYSMLFVVNTRRELEPDPVTDAQLLERIQRCSRLEVTHLVNNTNLGCETTPHLIRESGPYLQELSRRTGVPVLCTAVEKRYAGEFPPEETLPIEIFVKPPWEEEEKR